MDSKWTAAEKKIARRVFDYALNKELAALMLELKTRASEAMTTDDIWAIHDFLTRRRAQIDRKYDYRYSQLVYVFATLLGESWIEENDLAGLSEDKLKTIRFLAGR